MSRRALAVRRGLPPALGVAVPSDRRFLRSEASPAGPTPATRRVARTMLFVAVVGLSLFALRTAAHAFVTASVWTVQRIDVHGTARLSRGEVDAMLDDLQREDLLTVSLESYRQRLLGSAWVASATIHRRLPSTVEVDIVERVPMAIARRGDALYLVDRGGALIDEYGPQYRDLDLPIVDGLVSPATAADPDRLDAARRFLDAVAASPDLRTRVSQVDVSNARDVVVILGTDPTALHLGDDRFVERLRRYLELAPTLHDRLQDLDYVDLRFDDHVYVHPHADPRVGARRTGTETPTDGRS